MDDPTLDALTQRLDRLERRLRRWRILGSIAWAVLIAGNILSLLLLVEVSRQLGAAMEEMAGADEAVETVVVAKRFILVDDDGNPRAVLALRADGSPSLAFSDKDGKLIWKAP